MRQHAAVTSAHEAAQIRMVAGNVSLAELLPTLMTGPELAIDVESNGLHRYRPSVCTVQVLHATGVYIIDTLTLDPRLLTPLLGPSGPVKVVHDLSFDARLLAEHGVELGNVCDTSIAARMLGRTATGLGSLLSSELGVSIDKGLQHHDWTLRPITSAQCQYLAHDVFHLFALRDSLFSLVEQTSIGQEVAEETRYRLDRAIQSGRTPDVRPPHARLKGIDKVRPSELPVVRRLAALREERAQALDVPAHRLLSADLVFLLAAKKPTTEEQLFRFMPKSRGDMLAPTAVVHAIKQGMSDDRALSESDRALLFPPKLPPAMVRARRDREARLSRWRKQEALDREVDEQVVLPGHCLQDLASLPEGSPVEAMAAIEGIGAFRVARDAPAWRRALGAAAEPPP